MDRGTGRIRKRREFGALLPQNDYGGFFILPLPLSNRN
jgi:hypothetical protein